MGSSTGKDLRVLCYQHHRQMSLEASRESADAQFRCQEPGCLIRYNSSRGYFLDTQDKTTLEQEILPRVICSADQSPMYLAETQAATKSYRLWKCPKCGASRTHEGASGGLGKSAGT